MWSKLYNEKCVNKATDEFYRVVFNIIQSFVPKTVVRKPIYPWDGYTTRTYQMI